MPIVKLPGKIVTRAISTGLFPSNKEFDYLKNMTLIKRVSFNKKKLKLKIPTMASYHSVLLLASWRSQLDRFTDPKTGDEQDVWSVDSLGVHSYGIDSPMGYDLSATVKIAGGVKAVQRGKISIPKASFIIDFESIGPTGSKTKTQQIVKFEFLKGGFKKA